MVPLLNTVLAQTYTIFIVNTSDLQTTLLTILLDLQERLKFNILQSLYPLLINRRRETKRPQKG